jgi:hypothetical protein
VTPAATAASNTRRGTSGMGVVTRSTAGVA